jgi:hypothetical protein
LRKQIMNWWSFSLTSTLRECENIRLLGYYHRLWESLAIEDDRNQLGSYWRKSKKFYGKKEESR